MSDCKPNSIPTIIVNLTLKDGTPLPNPKDFRSFVTALQYLSLTRPNVAFAINKLPQFMHRPTIIHWATLKRLLRYLHGTVHHDLLTRRDSLLHLHAFTDAD